METILTSLAEIVKNEVEDYARGGWWQGAGYAISDQVRQIYSVVFVPDRPRPFPARVVVMARVVEDWVMIDEDTTDRPLLQELVRAGIPRARIVLLYAGETAAEPSTNQ